MTRRDTRREFLREFADAATLKAEAKAGRRLGFKEEDGIVRFHCPLDGHAWKGDDPGAAAWLKDGRIRACCRKCIPKQGEGPEREAEIDGYTRRVLATIGWEQGNVVHGNFGWDEIRSHGFLDRSLRFRIVHFKVRFRDARKKDTPWFWRYAPVDSENWRKLEAREFIAEHYPELGVQEGSHQLYLALCWFDIVRLVEGGAAGLAAAGSIDRARYRKFDLVIITEGERDAETVNRLMDLIGNTRVAATCLPHPKPTVLASHHKPLLDGATVAVIADCDGAGAEVRAQWASMLWGTASVKLVDLGLHGLSGGPEDKDLTDWVAAQGGICEAAAHRLLEIVDQTQAEVVAPKVERPWREKLTPLAGGKGIKSDCPENAALIWTEHPSFAGKVWRNTLTGMVEIDGPPWAPERTVADGDKNLAIAAARHVVKRDRISLSTKTLAEALAGTDIITARNPNADLLDAEWDETPWVSALATALPLDVPHAQGEQLWAAFVHDLVRKLRGEFVAPQYVLGLAVPRAFDLAPLLLGERGVRHHGILEVDDFKGYAELGKALVQVDLSLIGNATKAQKSVRIMLSPFFRPDWRVTVRRPTPMVIAVGRPPSDHRNVEDQCYLLGLRDGAALDGLGRIMRGAIAEVRARMADGPIAPPARSQIVTVDEALKLEAYHHILRALQIYVRKNVNITSMRPVSTEEALQAQPRAEPVRHVIREQFFAVMHNWLWESAKRSPEAMARDFNAAARAIGFKEVKVTIWRSMAASLGWEGNMTGKEKINPPGLFFTDERLDALDVAVETGATLRGGDGPGAGPGAGSGGGAPPPQGSGGGTVETGADDLPPPGAGFSPPVENPSNPAGAPTPPPPRVTRGDGDVPVGTDAIGLVCARADSYTLGAGAGAAAIDAVGKIVGRPGTVGLDFETFPTDPKWHAALARDQAGRGDKGKAAERAELDALREGRAHRRLACTVQVAHEDGAAVLVHLNPKKLGPDGVTAALSAMFADVRCTLVAHNAQFEAEVLARHGVEADIECTLVAAKCLYLEAVAEDRPQPVSFSLAALVEKEFGRYRDKTIRDRDWREPDLDDEAIAYCLADARDAAALWRVYEDRLREGGLWDGYKVIQGALLPTAELNMAGMALDRTAHGNLIKGMDRQAENIKIDLDRLCAEKIDNHGSTAKISDWVIEHVLETPVKPPVKPAVRSLFDFIREKGGIAPDEGGEINNIDLPKNLVRLDGLSLDAATEAAHEAGYLGHLDWFTGDEAAEKPSTHELVDALREEAAGHPRYTDDDADRMAAYETAEANFEATKDERPDRFARFAARLRAMAGIGWNRTRTGHLRISKGAKLRKAEQLRPAYPDVAEYLAKHAAWNKATKLIQAFGEPLARWVDTEGGVDLVRGQFRVFGTVTGRHSCVHPNLQQMPHSAEFRALFRAAPGRKLVICDYSQIELRLAAILAPDERLLEVYRANADVHRENAAIVFDKPPEAVTKEERQAAKPIGFLVVYGGGAAGLVEAAGIDMDRAELFLARFLGAYAGLAAYRVRAPEEAAKLGYIPIRPNRRIGYDPAAGLGTTAINYPVQGGAASVQMRALRRVRDALAGEAWLDAKVAASVHDELILDAPDDERAYMAKDILEAEMRAALIEVFPEAIDMGADRLADAGVVDTWAEKS